MLMRTDPFRDLDRLTQQVFGTAARPAFMPMDAWRSGDVFHIEFDLPGVSTRLDRPRRRAQRADRAGRARPAEQRRRRDDRRRAAARRVQPPADPGRQPQPGCRRGHLQRRGAAPAVPVAEKAKPRKISIDSGSNGELEGDNRRLMRREKPGSLEIAPDRRDRPPIGSVWMRSREISRDESTEASTSVGPCRPRRSSSPSSGPGTTPHSPWSWTPGRRACCGWPGAACRLPTWRPRWSRTPGWRWSRDWAGSRGARR